MRASTLLAAAALLSAATVLGSGIAAAQPADSIPRDGVYLVGVDILPGTYEAPGSTDPARSCDWRRLWKVEGDATNMHHIIDNNYTKNRPVRVTIKPSDIGFRTVDCGPWRMVPRPPTGSFGG